MEQIAYLCTIIIKPYNTDIYDYTISNPHFRKVQANRFGIHRSFVIALQGGNRH